MEEEVKLPLIGLLYKHFKGGLYVIRGFAHEENTEEISVIYNDTRTGKMYHRYAKDFFAKHPKTGVVRFELVTHKE